MCSNSSTGDPDHEKQSAPELDLAACSVVSFEVQGNTPGVGYVTPSGEEGWTPVRPRRGRRRSQTPTRTSKSSDLVCFCSTIQSARDVTYQAQHRIHVPSLKVRRGCTSASCSVSGFISSLPVLLLLHELELNHNLNTVANNYELIYRVHSSN